MSRSLRARRRRTVGAGQAYSFVPSASDADGDPLTFSVAGKPAWAAFNPANGQLSGTPGTTQVGSTGGIVISVSDGKASSALAPFSIAVTAAPNRAPTITGTPASSVVAGQPYSFTPSASDADGDALSFSIQNRPAWATFASSTGQLSGTPTRTQVGSYGNILISVSDGKTSDAPRALRRDSVRSAEPRSGHRRPTRHDGGRWPGVLVYAECERP